MKSKRPLFTSICYVSAFLAAAPFLPATETATMSAPASPGNPYWPMTATVLRSCLNKPDKEQFSEKELAHKIFWYAWGGTAPQSTAKDKAELITKASMAWDALVQLNKEKGKESPLGSFWSHLQLLESLRYLKKAPGINPQKWEEWAGSLRPYIEDSYRDYGHATDANWATKAAKVYPNADAQHAAVMSAAWLVYGDQKYKENAHEFIAAMDTQLRSPGAWLYYCKSTPIPLYHGFEIIFLGRCYQLTGDPLAADQIIRTKDYYPYTYSPENTVEFSTSPWWKQMWNPSGGPYHAVEMVAWLTGDGRNRWFADLRAKSFARHYWIVYCGEAYDAAAQKGLPTPEPFPDQYIVKDDSIDGFRGRFGTFSWAGARGKNAMSFASAMIANSKLPNGYDAYLQFAHIGIPISGMDGKAYYNSLRLVANPELIPTPGQSIVNKDSATLQVSYIPRLQANPEKEYNDWMVKENWLFTKQGLVGILSVRALQDRPEALPKGVLRFGPETRPHLMRGTDFSYGSLKGRILQSDFDKIEMRNGSPDQHEKEPHVEIHLTVTSLDSKSIVRGKTFSFAVLITPEEGLPAQITENSAGGWKITLGNMEYTLPTTPESN